MSNTLKIDPRAFSRGVDEVLLLKPVRRVISSTLREWRFGHSSKKEDRVAEVMEAPKGSGADGRPSE